MPRFYFRVATEQGRGRRLSAVCYGLADGDGGKLRLHVLLADEWGEKEILRKMKDMGLFELGQAFIPIGPRLKEDFTLTVSRAISYGILRLEEDSRSALIEKKLSGIQIADHCAALALEEKFPRKETNVQLTKRLCAEGETFLRDNDILA